MPKTYSETIKLNANFNPSEILSGIKKIQQALEQASTPKGKSILSGVGVEVEKVERALQQMSNQMEKGFRNDSDVKSFLKSMEATEDAVLSIHKNLKDVANTSLSENAKELEKQLALIDKQISSITKNFKTDMGKMIKESSLPESTKNYLKNLVDQGKAQKQVYAEAKKDLQEQIALQRKAYIDREQQLKSLARTSAKAQTAIIETANKQNLFGKAGISSDLLELSKKYGSRSGATLGTDVRLINEKGNVLPTTKRPDFENTINSSYVKILTDIALAGGTAEQAVKSLYEAFKSYGIVSGKGAVEENPSLASSISNKVQVDLTKIQEAVNKTISVKNDKGLTGIQKQIETWKEVLSSGLFDQLGEKAEAYGNKVENLAKKQEDARQTAKQQVQILQETKNELENEGNNIKEASGAWEDYRSQLIATTEQQKQIDDGFAQILSRLKYLFSIGTVFNFIRREVSQTFQDVQNLDKSFAQIAMVTKYSVNEMWQSYDQYAEMANRLGQSTNDVIQASALFYQQGHSPFINEVEIFIIPG